MTVDPLTRIQGRRTPLSTAQVAASILGMALIVLLPRFLGAAGLGGTGSLLVTVRLRLLDGNISRRARGVLTRPSPEIA